MWYIRRLILCLITVLLLGCGDGVRSGGISLGTPGSDSATNAPIPPLGKFEEAPIVRRADGSFEKQVVGSNQAGKRTPVTYYGVSN